MIRGKLTPFSGGRMSLSNITMRLLYLLIPALLAATVLASATSNVQASVTVPCPFKMVVNALPTYPLLGDANINFTINSLGSCNTNTSGYLYILNSTSGNVLYQQHLSITVTPTPTKYYYTFNTLSIGNITAVGKVYLASSLLSNQSETTFEILSPANIVVAGFSSQSQTTQGSQMQFFVSLKNMGQYASDNITLKINSIGPSNSVIIANALSLSPQQSENVTITSTNSTVFAGSYTANVFVSYSSFNSIEKSNTKSLSYSVVRSSLQSGPSQPSSSGGIPSIATISSPPGLSIESSPLYVTLLAGTSMVSKISFVNTGANIETISVKIPSTYSNLLSASATDVVISPRQSISIDLLFNAPAGISAGMYLIPVNITTKIGSEESKQTEYLASTIYPSSVSGLMLLNQLSMLNNSRTASGTVLVQNPIGKNMSNMAIQTIIPKDLVPSVSDISTYGLPARIFTEANNYVITWGSGSLPNTSTAYAYYTITNVTSPTFLSQISNQAELPSRPSQQNVLKLINVDIPVMYTNSNATIAVDILYTGTSADQITFSLGGADGITVINGSTTVTAVPNENIIGYFTVRTAENPQTALLTIYVYSKSANLSYTIPMVVLPNPANTSQAQQASNAPTPGINAAELTVSGVIVLAVALLYSVRRRLKRPKYNPDRAYKLKRLRDKIDLSE